MGEANNRALKAARRNKNDEFYTQLPDIEQELKHYTRHFQGKVVYCNCDDPRISNFFHYFSYNFEHLGLKKLVSACYKNQARDLFSRHDSEQAIWLEYEGAKGGNVPSAEDIGLHTFKGDGDFRSEECIQLLKEADIVVTNPPFSLFREYISQLVAQAKKFIVIGNLNAVAYKMIFPLIQDNQIWLGPSIKSGDREFMVPEHYPLEAARFRIDESGSKFIRVKGVRWFTNLEFKQRHEDLILYKTYKGHEDEYPKYDNYDAINIDKVKDIPLDYAGGMGVPISFLDKHNPDQFKIIGMDRPLIAQLTGKQSRFILKGKELFPRIVIQNKNLGNGN